MNDGLSQASRHFITGLAAVATALATRPSAFGNKMEDGGLPGRKPGLGSHQGSRSGVSC